MLLHSCWALGVAAGNSSRNLLYIVYDDLRPDISAYDVSFMHTPNIQRLADTGTLFERAYCQEAVCSPSRMSFTTGRRPSSTKTWNFIDHFRNAECPTQNRLVAQGTPLGGDGIYAGGAAQCCTACTAAAGCAGFNYVERKCTLLTNITGWAACPASTQPVEAAHACLSGTRGAFPQWTPLPAHFRNHGYLVLGVGKYYHPGGYSIGGGDNLHPGGAGSPPLADRSASWSAAGPNGTVQFPDQRPYITKWGRFHEGDFGPFGNFEYLNPDDEACRKDGASETNDYCNPPCGTPPATPRVPPTRWPMRVCAERQLANGWLAAESGTAGPVGARRLCHVQRRAYKDALRGGQSASHGPALPAGGRFQAAASQLARPRG